MKANTLGFDPMTVLAMVLLALAALCLGWLWGAARARREAAAQHEQIAVQARRQAQMEVQATANAHIATAQERVRGLEAERVSLLGELQHIRAQAADWRQALDLARDDRAQLAERAARVPRRTRLRRPRRRASRSPNCTASWPCWPRKWTPSAAHLKKNCSF